MKVLMVNGSPHEKGCTFTALSEVAGVLNKNGIETEIMWIGHRPVSGCMSCGGCKITKRCVFKDCVNEFLEKAESADGFVFGAPVHYASVCGAMSSFLDRALFGKSGIYAYKPAAAVVSCRRGGASAAFDRLNKYFTIACMPIVSSTYWNSVHGSTPEEVKRDAEGMQVMRNIGSGMAWMLRCIEAGAEKGILPPVPENAARTDFIR